MKGMKTCHVVRIWSLHHQPFASACTVNRRSLPHAHAKVAYRFSITASNLSRMSCTDPPSHSSAHSNRWGVGVKTFRKMAFRFLRGFLVRFRPGFPLPFTYKISNTLTTHKNLSVDDAGNASGRGGGFARTTRIWFLIVVRHVWFATSSADSCKSEEQPLSPNAAGFRFPNSM